ncbi:LysR family transcriptional regulator [Lederbergia wuyishanensis]|uniref:DNA-binding transcriptional LysR family regulator n=1 Tax=Lederbergia wuyishanensis TaxID=1347903 RepID=A0ABU0D6V4_9BACI|nr:LysR family transcriptional regulator [Lederbergia wuyishanensis]MCJ8008822.1 LysR family transcriptional regulator [Lederbergia wuyishanensis]MDQ0344144.1 DNA-binding transcriptional LysR family regulator [Lederbergia wuyishanensis]
MEFKDLEIFQLVADRGTITAAAEELNYVQSNITSRIRKLEAEMNTPLINRHRRGMSLTPEGKKLLTYSTKILFLKEEMKKAVQINKEPSGKLEIGTIESVIHLPKILSSYIKKYTDVDLSVFTGVTKNLVAEVLNHKLDGAFITESDFDHDLVSHEVFQEELVLISDTRFSTLEELKEEPILCFSQGCGYRARLAEWYKDQNITPKKIMEFGTLETILRSVVMGLGIAFVPKSEVIRLEKDGLIQFHKLPEQYSKIKTVFIRRSDTYLTPTIEKFIETIEINKQENIFL